MSETAFVYLEEGTYTFDVKLNKILEELDLIARDYDHYEYGLPLHVESYMDLMRVAIIEGLKHDSTSI